MKSGIFLNKFRYIDLMIEILLYSIVFLIPVYFALYKTNSPFVLSKAIIFQILTEIAFVFFLIKIYREKKIVFYIKKKYFFVIIPFFIALVLAVIFSTDPYNSFRGSYWRSQGLFMHLHYLLFFILLILNINSREKMERLISAVIFGSIPVFIFGIMQWLGLDNMAWKQDIPVGGRVASTMGQPVFLANYLLFVLFLTGYRIFISKRFLMRFFYVFLFFSQFLCFMFTNTRGAIIGFFGGIVFLFFLLFIKILRNKNSLLKLILFISLFPLLFGVMVGAGKKVHLFWQFYGRFSTAFDFNYGSTGLRIKYWTAGLDAWSKKPFLGYGLDGEQEVFVDYYHQSWIPFEKIGLVPDRAHNEFLDLAIQGGLILLLSYLFLVFFVFLKAYGDIDNIKNEKDRILLAFLLGTLFAHEISLFFSFNTTETIIYFYLFIAFIFLILNSGREEDIILKIKNRYSGIVFLCILAVFSLGSAYANLKKGLADYYFYQARSYFVRRDYPGMSENYGKVIYYDPGENHYKSYMINDLASGLHAVDSPEIREMIINFIGNISLSGSSGSYSRLLYTAKTAMIKTEFVDEKYFKEAENLLNKAMARNPFLVGPYMDLAYLYDKKGNYNKAIIIYDRVLSFLPPLASKELNVEHRQEVKSLLLNIKEREAKIYLKNEEKDKALDLYIEIIKTDPFRYDIYDKIAELYHEEGDLDRAIWYFKRNCMFFPDNKTNFLKIAEIYKEKGDESNYGKYYEAAQDQNL